MNQLGMQPLSLFCQQFIKSFHFNRYDRPISGFYSSQERQERGFYVNFHGRNTHNLIPLLPALSLIAISVAMPTAGLSPPPTHVELSDSFLMTSLALAAPLARASHDVSYPLL
jgi:hypothetical protein